MPGENASVPSRCTLVPDKESFVYICLIQAVDADLLWVEREGKGGAIEIICIDVEFAFDKRTIRVIIFCKGFLSAICFCIGKLSYQQRSQAIQLR